jgi:hypothetical protein
VGDGLRPTAVGLRHSLPMSVPRNEMVLTLDCRGTSTAAPQRSLPLPLQAHGTSETCSFPLLAAARVNTEAGWRLAAGLSMG